MVDLAPYVNVDLVSDLVGLEQDVQGENLHWNLGYYNFVEVGDIVGNLRIVPLNGIVAEGNHVVDTAVVRYFAEGSVGDIGTAAHLEAGGNVRYHFVEYAH